MSGLASGQVRAVLTDIEGTTSSLSFVKDVLFPYSRARLPAYVREHRADPEIARLLEDARHVAGKALDDEALVRELLRWIDEDRKLTPLKALQGLIWEDGYRRCEFTAHVYPDAARCLRAWKDRGIALYVYSSGSVHAQRLLFAHTGQGDLTALFSGYFDTTIGDKRDTASYRTIAAAIGLPPQRVLFLSDVVEELDAARAEGMQTAWVVREGALVPDSVHAQVRDFDAVEI
jgi:enolase-phosphatase E1